MDKLDKLESLLKLVDESISKEDFIASFENVVNLVLEMRDNNDKEIKLLQRNFSSMSQELKNDTVLDVSALKQQVNSIVGKKLQDMIVAHETKMLNLEKRVANIRDGEAGKDADEEKIVSEVLAQIPEESGLGIVRKVNALPLTSSRYKIDASHIKNLPKLIKSTGKQMLVGGIRFLEQLVDVSILPTKKRQDLLIQYNTTNNRWENGVALTVSTTAPSNPEVNDLWVQLP